MRGDLNRVHLPLRVGRKSSSRIVVFWWVVFGTLLGPGTTTIRPFLGVGGVVPGFLHTTDPPMKHVCVLLGGDVCGGVVV